MAVPFEFSHIKVVFDMLLRIYTLSTCKQIRSTSAKVACHLTPEKNYAIQIEISIQFFFNFSKFIILNSD